MNNLIAITQQGDALVVDSRLIAESLGINHESFTKTIARYKDQAEQAFGHLRLEVQTVTNSVGAINKAKYYLLTEDQATFLMTLSRNTLEVVACKITLSKAFRKPSVCLNTKVMHRFGIDDWFYSDRKTKYH